jgi:hypothetical protein
LIEALILLSIVFAIHYTNASQELPPFIIAIAGEEGVI